VLVQIGGSWSQAARARRLRRTVGREREIFRLEGRVRFKTDDVATIAQVKERAAARADGTTLQTVLVEIDRAEVFAVATVLPLDFDGSLGLAFEINLA